jgi:hypothetical protein
MSTEVCSSGCAAAQGFTKLILIKINRCAPTVSTFRVTLSIVEYGHVVAIRSPEE